MAKTDTELESLQLPAAEPYEDGNAAQSDPNILDVLTELARRKALIAKVTGVSIVAGIVLSFALPVQYTSTTKIMPPQQTQSTASMLMSQLTGMGGSSLAAMAGGGLGLKNPNDIYLGLLNSRTVADAIINQFGMRGVYHAANETKAREKLAKHTEVLSEKSGLIAISFTDRDKQRAAAIANAYTDQLRALTKTLAVTEASQRRLFYEQQLKQAKDDLVNATLAFQKVQQQKGLVQPEAQAKAMIEGLAALRAQVASKQVQVQTLRSYSTENNPEVQLAERELASLQAEETRMEQGGHGAGAASLGIEDVPSAGIQYLRAQHELLYQQALYDMLMKQYDAARLDESKEAAVIQVVETAIPADRKSSPKRGMLLALFSVAGLLIGALCALLQWWLELVNSDPLSARRFDRFRRALAIRK